MRATRRAFAFGAAASAVAPALAEEAEPYPYQHMGETAPSFALPRLGGGAASLSDYRNKALILSFGGLWCGDCIVEEQELNQLAHAAGADRDLRFLALHCHDRYGRWGQRGATPEASTAAVTAYRREMNVEYPLAFDFDGAVAHSYGLEWYPTILIIDRHHVVRGATTDLRRRTVARFLAEARAIASRR